MNGHCVECRKAQQLAWKRRNPEKVRAENADWRRRNPEKIAVYLSTLKRWSKDNPERVMAAQKRGIQKFRAANPGIQTVYHKRWAAKDPLRATTIAHASCQKWRKANKDKDAARAAKRRAIKMRRTPQWANLAAIEEFYLLAKRLTLETGIPHDVDHIIPLQGRTVSGLHVETNLCVIPARDNQRKRNFYGDPPGAIKVS